MDGLTRSKNPFFAAFVIFCVYVLNFRSCWCLNEEGVALLRFKERIRSDPYRALSNWVDEVGVEIPCYWSGIECSEAGHVVSVNLKDLCLRGTLAPDIAHLVHVKYINLRNNSLSGVIPEQFANLKELEVLDLGCNNFSGQIPCNLGNDDSMTVLFLDNNELLDIKSPETIELQNLSDVQGEEELLSEAKGFSCNFRVIPWNSMKTENIPQRKLLEEAHPRIIPGWRFIPPPLSSSHRTRAPLARPPPSSSPKQAPPKPVLAPERAPLPSPPRAHPLSHEPPLPTPHSSTPPFTVSSVTPSSLPVAEEKPSASVVKKWGTRHKLVMSAAIGGTALLLFVIVVAIYLYQSGKVSTVRPWATGLSGQLQKAFVTGVPKLKRSELEAACEDFSNVIGSSSICTLYKGTLSSGVEIAVASVAAVPAKEWSSNLKSQFRKKIHTLSRVNHKNFVNLLGYCEEDDPFTRMLVFEYAPNGTLFEHLHIREAEHLDWTMRLRIAMGMAYCLEHIHQLSPPLIHRNLTSSTVYLTEDYASKISDIVFWNEEEHKKHNLESNVYSFGVVLFEIMTGKLPYSVGSDCIDDWASDYLRGKRPLREVVDPMLKTYGEDQLQQIDDVIKSCVDPTPRQRPSMKEVCARLRGITGITPNGAIPKLSPLWWAELEILSTEAT